MNSPFCLFLEEYRSCVDDEDGDVVFVGDVVVLVDKFSVFLLLPVLLVLLTLVNLSDDGWNLRFST